MNNDSIIRRLILISIISIYFCIGYSYVKKTTVEFPTIQTKPENVIIDLYVPLYKNNSVVGYITSPTTYILSDGKLYFDTVSIKYEDKFISGKSCIYDSQIEVIIFNDKFTVIDYNTKVELERGNININTGRLEKVNQMKLYILK